MDLILRRARLLQDPARIVDVGIRGGRIAAVETSLAADGEVVDLDGRLLVPGFVETHIHLDKSCILDRCGPEMGDIGAAIATVARLKRDFTPDDVATRARRTLDKAVAHGTVHMRTHVEVDPTIGLRGLEGVLPLVKDYAWALDLQVCVFPQEGLLNNPGTDELMVEALKRGCGAVGAAPYVDSDPHGQIDRVFALAREFDVDIDMHLDFGPDPDGLDLLYVCDLTERFGYGGRVTVGHVTKLAGASAALFDAAAKRLAGAGVALTVLPSTDLYLMGRGGDHPGARGVTCAHKLLHHGVNCSLSTNNVLNPFTPFGDCSLLRMANLYANTCHVGAPADLTECLAMVTIRSGRLMNLKHYGCAVGDAADLAVLDCRDPVAGVAEIAPVLMAFKRGRRTMTRAPVTLHPPH